MSERRPVIAANWKMNKSIEEAEEFCNALLPRICDVGAQVVICPPFLALNTVVEATKGGEVEVAAQNMHFEPDGAFTGEVSAAMLLDAGALAVVLST